MLKSTYDLQVIGNIRYRSPFLNDRVYNPVSRPGVELASCSGMSDICPDIVIPPTSPRLANLKRRRVRVVVAFVEVPQWRLAICRVRKGKFGAPCDGEADLAKAIRQIRDRAMGVDASAAGALASEPAGSPKSYAACLSCH
jgi:hypothetical protein